MKLMEVYGCDHCSMVSRTKGSVKRHEARHCKKSPNRKTCGQCNNLERDEDGYGCFEHGVIRGGINEDIICTDFSRKL
jgi:hypothetical protein